LLLLFGRRLPYRIEGRSMLPALLPGDLVLADPRALRRSAPQVGDIVVARHPFKGDVQLIKRVASIESGRVRLSGDNPAESTDSRGLGLFPVTELVAKVLVKAH
jgi:nickel-type superoxide dismutase maturation protease